MHWLNIRRWKNAILEKWKSPSSRRTMGCSSSMYSSIRRKKKTERNIPQVSIFVPPLRIPVQSDDDLHKMLRGLLVPKDIADRISYLRNQIVLVAAAEEEDTTGGSSAIPELLLQRGALEDYLSLLLTLTKKENGVQEMVEFKWKNLVDGQQEVCVQSSWFELLSVIHMMAALKLTEANSMLVSKDHHTRCERVVSSEHMRNAVDLLLKAAGHLEFIIRDVLIHLAPDIRSKLPKDLHEGVLEAISIQALAQGTEIQLGLAVASKNATTPVKRRLACEQLSYLAQAHYCLSTSNYNHGYGKKQLLFIKWKYLEAKAAAYYYNGLIVDKGTEPSCHSAAVSCFLASKQLLAESKKACLCFCLAAPVTRPPALWGAMKHLNKKIPETASRKYQMYGYLLDQKKGLQVLPDLPEFQWSLLPEDHKLPQTNSALDTEKWEIQDQVLKEHHIHIDSEDEMKTM